MPGWALLVALVIIAANALAGAATEMTVNVLRSMSDFATEVRRADNARIFQYNLVIYPAAIGLSFAYLWPILRYFRRTDPEEQASALVRRRTLSAPLVMAAIGFAPWVVSLAVFPLLTIAQYGRWSVDLMSQHILSPLVNGFLAATASYFLVDLIFRTRVVPQVFRGPIGEVHGVYSLGLRARLLLFLAAVAFLPLFTMLGLARAAGDRLAAGVPQAEVIELLNHTSSTTFLIYVGLGIGLTALLARTLTRPLSDVAIALDRLQRGDLDVEMKPMANDEVGVVEDGVNRMAAALRDRERILQTFGRVVEPAIRDQLLRGDLQLGGDLRAASVMFCDLRGFTAYAESATPHDAVQTLNEFFTAMTAQVRVAGGFVDKFIGDALLVVFGLFDSPGAHTGGAGAEAAVRCALAMGEELRRLNRARAARGLSPLAVAGGIHTGEVVAGTIGAEDRHEFTVVGDTVNVAARLQETCKGLGWEFLISAETRDQARRAGFEFEGDESTAVQLRGRSEPVRVYRLS